MVPVRLLLYCLLFGGLYLIVVTVILELIERRLKLRSGIPQELVEESGKVWTLLNVIMEVIFFVFIPSLIFGFFYLLLPITGIRAGMGAALFAFMLGAVPVLMGMSVKIKLPMTFVLYSLLSFLVKLGGSLVIIAYLYSS